MRHDHEIARSIHYHHHRGVSPASGPFGALHRPEVLKLVKGKAGGSLDPVEVGGVKGFPTLNFNPARIEPTSGVWNETRKPLVAHWRTTFGADLFTVNVHLSSKGGSSSTQGDARPPVNSPVENRTKQVGSVAGFVKAVLDKNHKANIVVAGDFNEFIQTRSVYKPLTTLLTDIDEAAKIPEYERYSYVFDQNSQQLDHALISPAIKDRKVEFEHIHVNTWSPTLAARISDYVSLRVFEVCVVVLELEDRALVTIYT
ncbi:hypothetical protein NMY22_g8025 [Coprinellus aureogranulatus]|nr:hypothetical protein NMY22_g8025 [Coprinellus aureogranulatus]